jgi:hypothetical protein
MDGVINHLENLANKPNKNNHHDDKQIQFRGLKIP